ncbi:MAG TPA: N-acetyltransferase [Leucothrix mucor]|nr:N-acetyltransferase [Leucothrix mucor]
MKIMLHSHINEIPSAEWNALVTDNNPFLRHEFLTALENHDCVSEKYGWIACHIAVYDSQKLIGAMPLYEKHNTYGEFVFDHAWADAYQRNGLRYFPKLVSSIPYTPATGQRLLAVEKQQDEIFEILLKTAQQLCEQQNYSGFHCLFPLQSQHKWLEQQSLLTRHDCQFHWHNNHYTDFDHFLSALTAKKRKNIRQERRRVEQANITLRCLNGHTATDKDWYSFTQFYNQTFEEKHGMATLNYEFFHEVAQQLPKQVLLILADTEAGECIAGSLMFISDTTLYGRHWGAIEQVDKLHFEACYYQGIEYCIKHNIQHFEPGAQGEHKIARGFVPTLTRSNHWLNDSPFQTSIEQFVEHEKEAVKDYMSNLKSPYKDI